MGKTHEVVPFEKQDKLKENLLRTKDGNYIKITTASFWFNGERELNVSLNQDRLEEGLIRLMNGSYYRIDSIEEVEESDCFVATAVYGDINAPQVITLRKIRDEISGQSIAGRALVNIYYSGAGREIADFLRERLPSAIPVVRKGLDFVVENCSIDLE